MTSSLALLLALFSTAACTFIPPYTLPTNIIQLMGSLEYPGNDTSFLCNDIQFSYCQSIFNSRIGVNQSKSWRDGTYLYNVIENKLDFSQQDFSNTCKYYTDFSQCMGNVLRNCMNVNYMLTRGGSSVDPQNVLDYTRTFRSLDFMCTSASSQVIGKWGCLGAVPQTSTYKMCTSSFQRAVNSNNLCLSVNQTASCMSDAFNAACGTGSYGCNNFISEFNTACHGLVCP